MGNVSVGFTMSLDGFIAGPDDDVSRLFPWYFSGDVVIPVPDKERYLFVLAPLIIVPLCRRFKQRYFDTSYRLFKGAAR